MVCLVQNPVSGSLLNLMHLREMQKVPPHPCNLSVLPAFTWWYLVYFLEHEDLWPHVCNFIMI